jgi:hypothetical protein
MVALSGQIVVPMLVFARVPAYFFPVWFVHRHFAIKTNCTSANGSPGPLFNVLSGPRVPLMFFADGFALLALSHEDLQVLHDELDRFCDQNDMSVKLKKTKIVEWCLRRGRPA